MIEKMRFLFFVAIAIIIFAIAFGAYYEPIVEYQYILEYTPDSTGFKGKGSDICPNGLSECQNLGIGDSDGLNSW